MAIGEYVVNRHWWLLIIIILVVNLLMVISGYCIINYC